MNKSRNMGIVQQEKHSSHDRGGSMTRRRILCRIFMLVLIAAAVCVVGVGIGAAATITVDESGGADYSSIQAAIDDASSGDEIHVDGGTYYENVNVNKQLTLRGMDTGAGMPVVDAGGSGSAITLAVDGIILEGFTATNAGDYPEVGIKVTSNNNTLSSNNGSSNNWCGISIQYSSNNKLISNNASNNLLGIYLWSSSNNKLIDNSVKNTNTGIYMTYSSNNMLNVNNVSNNNQGIGLGFSNNNMLSGNNANSNNNGIIVSSSSNNVLSDNNANSNNFYGIHLQSFSNNNTLSGNNLSNNSDGIRMQDSSNYNILSRNNANSNKNIGFFLADSSNNTLIGNTASNNSYGILLSSSSNNILYHNNLDNTNNAIDYSNNQWDSGAKGNHYSDYSGPDSAGDGIGDTPYPIPGGSSADNYPLMTPWGYGDPVAPQVSLRVSEFNSDSFVLEHQGGDEIYTSNTVTKLLVNGADATPINPNDYFGTVGSGMFTVGERITVNPSVALTNCAKIKLVDVRSQKLIAQFTARILGNSACTDITPPTLTITSPTDGATFTTPTITVSGTASDDTDVASITVNGISAAGTTSWSADISLTEGANTITVVATDTSDNNATETITITYTPDDARGDFNGNGRVDIGDVAKVAFMVAGKVPVDMNADFNNNGRVDIGDAAKIAFYLAGKGSEL